MDHLKADSIQRYIDSFPGESRLMLEELRKTIQQAAPEAVEVISYSMPAFKYHGILVYFACHKNHIGFYPTGSGIRAFQEELNQRGYKTSRGTVQFPLHQPLPVDLITKMVTFRVEENMNKVKK